MKSVVLKSLAWMLAVIAYVPLLLLLLVLTCTEFPTLPAVARGIHRLIIGQAFRDFMKSVILTTVSPPAPPNPNFQGGPSQQAGRDEPPPRCSDHHEKRN